ncbi:DUF177 domain-containing protein [Croceicoccus sp. YJ47]|uniref:YceD family protein n=1 Tax=Croceicoccus sp. YJ47 TaxID=2798724 RepID=UPI001F15B3EF|nr:DUF177 domain-containing protein [Croceicoccus sp. YJ47]
MKESIPSEMPRWVPAQQADGRIVEITAKPEERTALAKRFGIVSLDSLVARLSLEIDGGVVEARGQLSAAATQACAVSGEDLRTKISEPLHFRFVPATSQMPDEIELEADELDEIPYDGDQFDLGEAVAQSVALAIDPFATGPDADRVRDAVGLEEPERENPFAVLKGAVSKGSSKD